MTDNVTPFPNPDEVIDADEQDEREYDEAFAVGREVYAKARREIEALAVGKSYPFQDGLWEGFYEE